MLARNDHEFQKWIGLALKAAPNDHAIRSLKNDIEKSLNVGILYWNIIAIGADGSRSAKAFGTAAALLEVALDSGEMRPEEELNLRRVRAECLRALDMATSKLRETRMEAYLPDERITLIEAVIEIDRELEIDEYDAESWNLKSAWCAILERNEDAINCANRALELRPNNYLKPYINKAKALRGMRKNSEALRCAQEALKHANGSEPEDLALVNEIISKYSIVRKSPSLNDLKPVVSHILKSAQVVAQEELGQQGDSIKRLTKGFFLRSINLNSKKSDDYVPLMAEFLSDFTPEVVYSIMCKAANYHKHMGEYCFYASLFVVVHSEEIRRRDAARFVALCVLAGIEETTIRSFYREAIFKTSSTSMNEMAVLDEIVKEQLRRINPHFPKLIAIQDSITKEELENTTKTAPVFVAENYPPNVGVPSSFPNRSKGCALIFGIIIILVIMKIFVVCSFI
ncbi:MAG: hypothetical protein IPO69_22140 [Saprospiraceae bacterium]|nr:hypothetical protein [Saprospiraceae bacterium]